MQKLIKDLKNYRAVNEQESQDLSLFINLLENGDERIFTRENKAAHISASCWITNQNHNKILLAYHNIYKSWAWLGGHADGEHDLAYVALKEAKEESGLNKITFLSKEIASVEILPVNGHIKNGKYVSAHLHLNVSYLLLADDKDTLQNKADENSAVAWFDIEDVLNQSSEKWISDNIYAKLNRKLKEY